MAVRLSHVIFSKFNHTTRYRNVAALNGCICTQPSFKFCSVGGATQLNSQDSSETEVKKKKTSIIPKVTLFHGKEMSVTTLEEAQKLAKRRDLKLIKIIDLDTKTQRPIYKLMTATEYHEEDIKQKEVKKKNKENTIKGEKLVFLNYNIANHDLEVNIKKIIKWVSKSLEVRVVINGDSSKMQKVVSN